MLYMTIVHTEQSSIEFSQMITKKQLVIRHIPTRSSNESVLENTDQF